MDTPPKISGRRGATIVAMAVLIIGLLASAGKFFEDVDASELMVVQSPMSGDLTVITDPGWAWQGFGTVTKYPRRNEFTFSDASCEKGVAAADGKQPHQQASSAGLGVRFYDGGTATLCGSMSWMMPTDPKSVIAIHRDFRSADAFEIQAIRRSMESAATLSGPMMSSFESAAGRRNELLQLLNDQTMNGVYKTMARKVMAKDVAGVEREMSLTEIVKDDKGVPQRAQASYVETYKATLLPMTISTIGYEKRVEDQIQEQQKATNAAVVAKANAAKAEQDSITIEAQGRAAATKTKWEQEQLNAKTIAEADAKVRIADAAAKEAELFKKSEVLRGEGEAARKRLVMEADGQLDKKLEALVEINAKYADAIAKAQPGAWAPNIQMGGAGQSGGDRAMGLIELLTAKTGKDLAADLSIKSAPKK